MRRQGGSQQAGRGEGVHGTFDEHEGVERGLGSGQPEAAAGLAGTGGHALESAAVGCGAGADEFGAGRLAAGVAAQEDGIAAGVGVEQALLMAEVEQVGGQAAPGLQEGAHRRPETVVARGEAEAGGGRGAGTGRQGGEGSSSVALFQEFDGLLEAAAAGVHDEVDGPAAAAALAVVEEARGGQAQDRAGQLPAGRVGGIGAVAELDCERLERGVADGVGAGRPARSLRGGAHLANSWQLCSRCWAETVRASSSAAAMRA